MTPESIKSFRDSRDWSQQQMAAELGVNQATVSRLETGVFKPRGAMKRLLERLMDERTESAA